MAIDKKAFALANSYTDETVIGGGAIKGKNCTISKIEDIDGGHRITFGWTLDNGTTKSQTLDVKDGKDGYTPVKDVDYFDGQKGDKGEQGIAGIDGKDGITYTPSIGQVTTVESNVEASASVSVDTETKEAVFNFAIPKGVGGNADTVNNHTVKSDVPENAVFTDTVYDDTELNAKLDGKADKNAVLNSLEVVNGNITTQIIPRSDGTHYRGFEDKSSNTYTDIVTKDGVAKIAKIENGVMTKLEKIATMDKIGSTDISSIGDGTVTDAISTVNSKLTATNSYFFGGRTYATYLSPHLAQKALGLPDAFKKTDVNNFYVSVTPEYTDASHVEKFFIQKDTGCFSVNFKSDDEIFNENSVVWFDYIVVINH